MAKFKNIFLQELGETTDTYNWRLEDVGRFAAKYRFETENVGYYVKIEELEPEYLAVEFSIDPDKTNFKALDVPSTVYDMFAVVTGEGNQFQVVATVLQIAKHAWKNRHEFFDGSEKLKGLAFDSAGSKDKAKARDRLYTTFIKKQFPQAKIIDAGNLMRVKVKK